METHFDPTPICEACRQVKHVDSIQDDDEVEPYRLCGNCAERLQLRCLRPLEWYNLATHHGSQKHLLHDDFYDEDGTATQPDIDDFSTDGMLAPTLGETSHSVEKLFDYCATRGTLGVNEFDALRALPTDNVFEILKNRADSGNTDILRVALSICANVLGDVAAVWIRDQYQRACEHGAVDAWGEAAAACLPMPDGLNMTIAALEIVHGRDLYDRIGTLSYFRSPLVFDWIERRAPKSNVGDSWGRLAAQSGLTWPKAEAWLAGGRPLSLIALDALYELSVVRAAGSSIEHAYGVPLDASQQQSIVRTLRRLMFEDTSSRVVRCCEYLIKNSEKIQFASRA